MVLALDAAYLGFPTSTIPFLIYSPVFLSGLVKSPLEMLLPNFDETTVFLSLKYLLSYLTVMVFLLLENLDYEAVPSFLFSALFKDFSVRPFRPLVFSSLYEVISLSISSLNLCLLGKTKWPPALLFVLTS